MGVLVLAGSKGGAGKTTLAIGIAGFLARQQVDFVLVDADPTRTASRWGSTIYEGPKFESFTEFDEDELAHLISSLSSKHAVVIVDTPGFANLSSSVAIASADAVLIPCKSSEGDLFEARTTSTKVRSLSVTTRRTIPAKVVLNSVRTTAVAAHAAEQISEAGLTALSATLGHRADYEVMTHSGRVPHTGAAYREINALLDELRALDWLPSLGRKPTLAKV
jgi:chromosome partitioning protein